MRFRIINFYGRFAGGLIITEVQTRVARFTNSKGSCKFLKNRLSKNMILMCGLYIVISVIYTIDEDIEQFYILNKF